MKPLVVASWNVHAGCDDWGRPFDLIGAVRALDADVLVLQETWTPSTDAGGTTAVLADAFGYTVVETSLGRGRLAPPDPVADARWSPNRPFMATSRTLFIDAPKPLPPAVAASERYRSATAGSWGMAVLSRLPVVRHAEIDLDRLSMDRVRRAALVTEIAVPDGPPILVIGTHMSHLIYGSPRQFRRLRNALRHELGPGGPAILAGDMNLWGPPLRLLFPGWRPAVRGKTWPAWQPHSQVDHLLMRGPLRAVGCGVAGRAGSDHRAIWARVVAAEIA